LDSLPPEILNADSVVVADKPIQWMAGMMEVPTDPESRIRTMELMIQEREAEEPEGHILLSS
jgi:hypothetical protein